MVKVVVISVVFLTSRTRGAAHDFQGLVCEHRAALAGAIIARKSKPSTRAGETMKKLTTLIAVSVLVGCQTAAQRQANQMQIGIHDTVTQVKACVTTAYNGPEGALIRPHRPLDVSDATLQQLNDPSFASPEEVAAIYTLHDRVQQCRKEELQRFSSIVPSLVPILSDLFTDSDAALLDLINKKSPWGQYIQTEQRLQNDSKRKITAEMNRIHSDLQQSYQAEMQQRAQAAQAMSNYLQNQQAINALNKPTYTTCNTFGPTTNCLTH